MINADVAACFEQYASWLPGMRRAPGDREDLIAQARRALIWAITATDAQPRGGWVWSGYANQHVNPRRVADFLRLHRENYGADENYIWANIADALTLGCCFVPELWLALHDLRSVPPEWIVYHALYAAKDSPDVELEPVLLTLNLWSEAQPVIMRVLDASDSYIDAFEYEFFTRESASMLMKQVLGIGTAG